MKVVIFEIEHFEGAFPVIKLFDMPSNEITVYTSGQIYKRFTNLFFDNAGRYNWTILPDTNKFRFFYSLYKNLKNQKPDILYINTISNNHLLYAFVLSLLSIKRIVLTVHDINCLFESRFSFNFRKAIIHWGKKWLTKQVKEFNVVSDTMIGYLQTKTKQKRIHNIPGAVFEDCYSPQSIKNCLTIVVPGSLDKRRRNYEQVFELATIADKDKLPIQIVLLGGYFDQYGKNVTDRANKFRSDFCKIVSYDIQIVNQDEFDKQMNIAHFVFIPSVINTKICGNIPEIYGITKSSGNIFDIIKHAKPFIIPAGLVISANLHTSCFKYQKITEVAGFLKKFIAYPVEYEYWQKKALENSGNYTRKKVGEKNISLFGEENS